MRPPKSPAFMNDDSRDKARDDARSFDAKTVDSFALAFVPTPTPEAGLITIPFETELTHRLDASVPTAMPHDEVQS